MGQKFQKIFVFFSIDDFLKTLKDKKNFDQALDLSNGAEVVGFIINRTWKMEKFSKSIFKKI